MKFPKIERESYGNRYSARLPFSEEGLPTEWAEPAECAPGVTVEFILPQNGRVTQYIAQEYTSHINCTVDPKGGPAYLFGCAHSTRSLK